MSDEAAERARRYRQTVIVEIMGPDADTVCTTRLKFERAVSVLMENLSRLKGAGSITTIPDREVRDSMKPKSGG